MFHVYGVEGRVFLGTLEQLRQQRGATGVVGVRAVRRVSPVGADTDRPPPPDHSIGHEALAAYGHGKSGRTRQPLTHVADVMCSPALTLPAEATLGEAWRLLAHHGIGQAPVVDAGGVLVGLIGRAELMPAAWLAPVGAAAANEPARLSQPVTALMWSPVPCASPGSDLRQVAALLLDTGLPGVPVADTAGRVLGFVSRTDLLRALATDPPLDVWG